MSTPLTLLQLHKRIVSDHRKKDIAPSNFEDVSLFHAKFDLHQSRSDPGPQKVPLDVFEFRLRFLYEELHEFEDAWANRNEADLADALIDLVYVAMGTAHIFGFPWQELWDEVQRANMSKVRATSSEQSTRRSKFDVVKPKGWTPPNIAAVLQKHGWPKDDGNLLL